MQPDTIHKLTQLTHQFYQYHADSFSKTRNSAWSGWQELLPFFQTDITPSVLDIGCGNGRFAQFLKESSMSFNYHGLDNSAELIKTAQQQVECKNCAFSQQDCFSESLVSEIPNRYSHLVLFGILHHLPSQTKRLNYIAALTQLLQPGGYIIISFWQPLNSPERFIKKQLDPTQFGIRLVELEDNDLLLGWQENTNYARYCHSFSDHEIDWYIQQISDTYKLIKRFQADGKTNNLNQYLIWQKTTS